MNHKELGALRSLFFLNQLEAAELIGECTKRAWNYWENDKRAIPDAVKQKMNTLIDKRRLMIESVEQLIEGKQADKVELAYYLTFEEYKAQHSRSTALDWHMAQSVAAHFLISKKVTLV